MTARKFVDFNGVRYYKREDQKGYYHCGHRDYKKGAVILLHRAIWASVNGPTPEGFVIHHIDHNKDNNDISNFEMLSKQEHDKQHNEERVKVSLICYCCGIEYVGIKNPQYEQSYCSDKCGRRQYARRKRALDKTTK